MLLLSIGWPALSNADNLTVILVGLRNTAGVVRLSVYNHPETFLGDNGRVARYKAPVTDTPLQMTLTGLQPGTYALSVVHDENNDGKLNRNLFGIPLEGYGFSNDAPSALGPPSFVQAAIVLRPGHATITITIRYFKLSHGVVDQRPSKAPLQ